ncbi:Two-component sensor histidine kinase (fragment) [Flavobacterium sp. 9AF]
MKYSDENPSVIISAVSNEMGMAISVLDNGMGVPKKDLPFIFDKFYRVERKDSKEIEGFGIGLAYVKKIVQMHEWKIKAENNNPGLKITIQIPKSDIYE